MEKRGAARKRGASKLSEYESKQFLADHGVPVTLEKVVQTEDEAVAAAGDIGYPVALKGSGAEFTHKTANDAIQKIRDGSIRFRAALKNDLV